MGAIILSLFRAMSLFFCEALDGLGFWEKGGVITLVLCFLSFLFLFFMPERFTLRRIFAGVLSLYRGLGSTC